MKRTDILTIPQVVKEYDLPDFGVRGWVKRKAFPVLMCGNRVYIARHVLEAYLEKGGELYDAKKR